MDIDDYSFSSDPARMDLEVIHGYLTHSYWSPGIARERVATAMANSLCFAAFHRDRQVGFARVITDRATFAWLADVFVLEEHRGRGLSKGLLARVFDCPDLQGLRRFMLATRDAHGLYTQFGFASLTSPQRYMERSTPAASPAPPPGAATPAA